MHWPGDVDIAYIDKPIVIGYRERTRNKLRRILIEAPKEEVPKKLSLVDCLLLSKLPPVLREQVSETKEITHNVHELPLLS